MADQKMTFNPPQPKRYPGRGVLLDIKNTDKKLGANPDYYYVAIIVSGSAIPQPFLFTQDQLDDAKARAEKNPEDLPKIV